MKGGEVVPHVGLRVFEGKYRWLCECGAGTGVPNSGDVNDHVSIAQAQRNQWTDQGSAIAGMVHHRYHGHS